MVSPPSGRTCDRRVLRGMDTACTDIEEPHLSQRVVRDSSGSRRKLSKSMTCQRAVSDGTSHWKDHSATVRCTHLFVRRSAFSAREDTTEIKVFFDSGVDAADKCKPHAGREAHRDTAT